MCPFLAELSDRVSIADLPSRPRLYRISPGQGFFFCLVEEVTTLCLRSDRVDADIADEKEVRRVEGGIYVTLPRRRTRLSPPLPPGTRCFPSAKGCVVISTSPVRCLSPNLATTSRQRLPSSSDQEGEVLHPSLGQYTLSAGHSTSYIVKAVDMLSSELALA